MYFTERLGLPQGTIKFSSGWLQRYQRSNKLRSIRIHGDIGSANEVATDAALPGLRAVIARYEPQNVFNMDETGMSRFGKSEVSLMLSINVVNLGLFYNLVPEKTVAQKEIEGVKKEKAGLDSIPVKSFSAWNFQYSNNVYYSFRHGSLLPSRPIRMVLKNSSLFYWEIKKTHCSKRKFGQRFGFYYRNNKKALVTGALFQEWLKKFDTDMKVSKLYIFLFH